MAKNKEQKILVFDAFQNIPRSISVLSSLVTKFGVEIKDFPKCSHPREDFHKISKKYPVFVVSDGVTLELDEKGKYPKTSGAGKVAKIFCDTAVKEIEKSYEKITFPDIKKVFSKANQNIKKFNDSKGRTKDKINYWDFDLFSATGAFVALKGKTVYWGSICDSFVICFKKNSGISFKSPCCWDTLRKNLPKNWMENNETERKKMIRKTYRNGVDESGKLVGYGVANGEKAAERYFKCGKFSVEDGDVVLLITDGFENYIELPDFIKLFLDWPSDIKQRFKKITDQKSIEDPNGFGRERTIIAVKIL